MRIAKGTDLFQTGSKSLHVNDLNKLVEVIGGQGVTNKNEEGGAATPPPGGAAAPPSLTKRNNCIIEESGGGGKSVIGAGRRAFVLEKNVEAAVQRWGIEKTAELSITFEENVTSKEEAERRWHSFSTNVIEPEFGQAIKVAEHQEERGRKNGDCGAVHFHVVIQCPVDIRTGYVFSTHRGGKDRGACDWLKAKRKWLLKTLPQYGFGKIHHFGPIRKNGIALGKYMAKYLSKGLDNRDAWEKGSRLVSYIGFKAGEKACTMQFSWFTEGGWKRRRKVEAFAKLHGIKDIGGFKERFGPKWAYKLDVQISAMPDPGRWPVFHAQVKELLGETWKADLFAQLAAMPPVFVRAYEPKGYLVKGEYVVRPVWEVASENSLARETALSRGKKWICKLPRFRPWMLDQAAGPRIGKAAHQAALQASADKWGS